MSITIYGASDDLIEIDGDVEDEFGAWNDTINYIAVSTGLLATIAYGMDGSFWRIHVLTPGTTPHTLAKATDEKDDYTDRLVVEGDIKWVVVGKAAR